MVPPFFQNNIYCREWRWIYTQHSSWLVVE